MKWIILLFIAVLASSCLTSQLLESNIDLSSLPPDSYSFNRAYYDKDSLLHLDFNNLRGSNVKKNYYTVTINVNAIVNEYDKYATGNVTFKRRFSRKYLATDASKLICDSTCNIGYSSANIPLLNFSDVKAKYAQTLDVITDSSLMVYVNLLSDNCILKPHSNNWHQPEPANNYPQEVYVVQTPANPERYVALRIPLINEEGKWGLLPITLFLDVITSPIQLGFYILSHKSDDHNSGKKHERRDDTKRTIHPSVEYHH